MAHRTAIFRVHRDPNIIDQLGYTPEVRAVCTLNNFIEVFTVRRLPRLFGKDEWQVQVKLPAIVTGRPYGISVYKTLDEALGRGIDFVKQYFPLVEDTQASGQEQEGASGEQP